MRLFKISGLFLMFAAFLFAGPKHAITFNDFFHMQRIGAVAVSPDGHYAAFDLKTANIEKNNFKTDIWLLNLKTNTLRRFTNAQQSSSGPVWLPDGKTLYFNRNGQVWSKKLSEGQAGPVTDFAAGAGGAVISRDGKQMLFTSDVYPNCKSEACNKKKLEAVKNSPVKARLINHLFYRSWNRWLNGKRSHVILADVNGREARDVTPGDYDTPPLDLGGQTDYVFSADGRAVCFVRNTAKIVAASTNNDLFWEDLKTGKITRLTANPATDNNPHFSPDGRFIAYTAMQRPGFEADRLHLMLYDLKKKTITDLTPHFDRSVQALVWHPAGKEIYFVVSENGSHSIYKVPVKGGKVLPVLKGHFVADVQFVDNQNLLCKIQNEAMPYEIFKLNLQNKKLMQLTHINKTRLDKLQLSELEPFSFVGAKGERVHGFIMKPPFFDPAKKYPAIELIHGGPQGAWGDDFHYRWNYQMFAAPGYVVFMINFHGSRGYGQAFVDAVSKDWGGAPYEDIKKGTDYVLDHYAFIDKNRIGAAGASYGGFMINWIEGGTYRPFKCLVSHDGVFDQVSMYGATEELWFPEWEFNGKPWDQGSLYQKWNPAAPERVRRFNTPMLVIHGERDYRVPYTQGLQLFTALQRQGIKSELLFFPDEYHFVVKPQNARLWWKTVQAWFTEFLK